MAVGIKPTELSKGLADELSATLAAFRRQVRRQAGGPFAGEMLSGAQIELVRLVRQHPGTSVAEAAAELGVAANTVSTLVRQLADLGILSRTADDRDRRVARLHLTVEARTKLQRWRGQRNALVADAIQDLSDVERGAIATALPALKRIASLLAEHNPSTSQPKGPRA